MSTFYMRVGDELHERVRVTRDLTQCSCSRMSPAAGSASQQAVAWQKHVEDEAAARGLVALKEKGDDKIVRRVAKRAVRCPECDWQGGRETPFLGYAGPAGPCPRCGATLRAVFARPIYQRPTRGQLPHGSPTEAGSGDRRE